jgi:hypothetical protein
MPSAASGSTGSAPGRPKQDEGQRRRDRQLGRDQARWGSSQSPVIVCAGVSRLNRLNGSQKARAIQHLRYNLSVTRPCFHPRVIPFSSDGCHPQPRPVSGLPGPASAGPTFMARQQPDSVAFVRAGVDGTLLDPTIDLSPACQVRGSFLRAIARKSLNRSGGTKTARRVLQRCSAATIQQIVRCRAVEPRQVCPRRGSPFFA